MQIPSNGMRGDDSRRLRAQIRLQAALDDAEQGLVRTLVGRKQRSAQACVRTIASATSRRVDACGGTGWSRHTAMSEPSASWTAIECSGVKRCSRAVEVGAERDAVVVDRAEVAQADHLVAARVGQDRPVPGHELVQAAEPFDALVARAQVEVVGVAQDDLGADLVQVVGIERLDRGVGADRHEHRRLDVAVRRRQVAQAGARGAVVRGGLQDVERDRPASIGLDHGHDLLAAAGR